MSEAPGEPDSEIVTLRDDQAFVWSQSAASCKSFMFYKDGALGRLRNVARRCIAGIRYPPPALVQTYE